MKEHLSTIDDNNTCFDVYRVAAIQSGQSICVEESIEQFNTFQCLLKI